MNNLLVRAGAALALFTLTMGIANAGPPDKGAKMSGDCPVCHMKLASKKTKDSTVAVQLKKGGPVQYCCAKCKMPASVLVKTPAVKTPKKK